MSETSRDLNTDPLPEIGSLWRVPDLGACEEWASTVGAILLLREIYIPSPADVDYVDYTYSCSFTLLFGSVPEEWLFADGLIHLCIGLTPEARSYLLFNLEQVEEITSDAQRDI